MADGVNVRSQWDRVVGADDPVNHHDCAVDNILKQSDNSVDNEVDACLEPLKLLVVLKLLIISLILV